VRDQMREAWNQPLVWPLYILLALFVIAFIPAIRGYQKRERARGL